MSNQKWKQRRLFVVKLCGWRGLCIERLEKHARDSLPRLNLLVKARATHSRSLLI